MTATELTELVVTVGGDRYTRCLGIPGWRLTGKARDVAVGPKFCALLDRLATLEAATHPAQASGEPVAWAAKVREVREILSRRFKDAPRSQLGTLPNNIEVPTHCVRTLLELLPHPPVRGGEGAEESYWWCDVCSQRVEGRQVTYHEYHDGCGGKVREVTTHSPVLPVVTEAMVEAAAQTLWRCEMHLSGETWENLAPLIQQDYRSVARAVLTAALGTTDALRPETRGTEGTDHE